MLKPETPSTASFSAIPGNLGSFMNSVQTTHAAAEEPAFEAPSDELQDPAPDEPDLDFGDEDFGGEHRRVVPKNVGRGLARFTDRGLSFLMGLYAHAPGSRYRADDDEMGELEKAFADFVEETGINISPAINLIIAISAIYAFKMADVVQDRKAALLAEEEARRLHRTIDAEDADLAISD